MDGANKSKRLYTAYTLEQLYQFATDPKNTFEQAEKYRLAIRQRQSFCAEYVPMFVTPQIY